MRRGPSGGRRPLLHAPFARGRWPAFPEDSLKLGTRLFVALAIPAALLIVVFAVLEDGANRSRSREEVAREGLVIARAVQIATTNALRDRQLGDVRGLIDDISGHERILAIRLFDATGALLYAPRDTIRAPLPAPADVRAAIRSDRISHDRFRIAGHSVLGWLAPLDDPSGRPLGAVQVLQRESFVEEDAAASSRAIALFAALLILAVALTVFAVTHWNVARPIDELVRSVRGIGDGDWGAVVPAGRRDEFGGLAREFNSMRQRLADMHARLDREQDERRRVESDLREAERLASLGRFAAGVAHEIGTPLNVISGRAEALLRRPGIDDASARGLRIVAEQIERITRIVRGVLDFARVRELRLQPTELPPVIETVVELVEDRFATDGIEIRRTIPSALPAIAADPDQLQQVFLNLALNAAAAMPAGGALHIRVAVAERTSPEHGAAPRPCVTIAFHDSGVGIAPAQIEHVFEPFFTTKEVGSGTGLGLSISYGIVREHGGWIEVASELGRGTCMTVCLPLGPVAGRVAGGAAKEAA
jgi:signal transduction histidine kinase